VTEEKIFWAVSHSCSVLTLGSAASSIFVGSNSIPTITRDRTLRLLLLLLRLALLGSLFSARPCILLADELADDEEVGEGDDKEILFSPSSSLWSSG